MRPSPGGRIPVESSLLSSTAYSLQATLEIEFRNGAIYRYFLVPQHVFQGLITAQSKGAYFNRYIRACFHHERIA